MKKAFIQLHIATLLSGFTGIFGRLITVNEGLISWYRLLISGVVMFLFLKIHGRKQNIPFTQKMKLGLIGSVLGLHWLFFYGSIKYSNISVGVVCFALGSFFNALLAPFINKTKVSIQEIVLSGIGLCGIALIFGWDPQYRTGILLGVVSAAFSALYTVYNEHLARQYESNTIILYQMLGGFAGLSVVMPVFWMASPFESFLPSLPDLGWLLVLAIVCTVIMYILIIGALKYLPSFTVSLTFNLEPLYTILLAILIYRENKVLSAGFYAGLTLIVASVIIQMYRIRNNRKASPAPNAPSL